MKGFGESIAPTAAISAILGSYPFSCGLLREILQNSDDAKATKQRKLIHEQLGQAQGPALLAFNNALFNDEDWVALRSIHQSSKKTDTSKIGKYGITDTPQILSGDSLAVLDPHQYYFSDGGQKINICEKHDRFADQLAAFNLNVISPDFCPGTFFDGTIVRLPLRRDATLSEISTKVLVPSEIKDLLEEFAREEIGIAMLFLSHISTIEIMEVDERGTHLIARATVSREPVLATDAVFAQATCSVVVEYGTDSTQDVQNWVWTHAQFAEDDCAKELSRRLNRDAMPGLKREKLNAAVSLATPSPLTAQTDGRLFTYLPLPLTTKFPTHVHALFALTQARQNLRNASERGIVPGTADELLIEWNRTLFQVYIPRTWAAHIEQLTPTLHYPQDIFKAWPPTSQESSGGDSAYWNDVAIDVLHHVADEKLAVWPLCEDAATPSRDGFGALSDIFVAVEYDSPYVPALRAAGLKICIVPQAIRDILQYSCPQARFLAPHTVHTTLQQCVEQIGTLSPPLKESILKYLVSASNPALVIGIPIVPLANREYVALALSQEQTDPKHVLLTDEEVMLFSQFDPFSIHVSSLPESVRMLFQHSYKELNVTPLLPCNAARYVGQAVVEDAHCTDWIEIFWKWAANWPRWTELSLLISDQPLLPTSSGEVTSLDTTVFQHAAIDDEITQALVKCGITFLSSSFPSVATHLLEEQNLLKSPHFLPALLNFLDITPTLLTCDDMHLLHRHIAACCSDKRYELSNEHQEKLRALPIFPLLSPELNINSDLPLHRLPEKGNIIVVDNGSLRVLKVDGFALLPSIENTAFLSRQYRGDVIDTLLSHVDKTLADPTSESILIDMTISALPQQRLTTQLAFLQTLAHHRDTLAPSFFNRLRTIPFIPVGTDGTHLKPPHDIIDPYSTLTRLYDPEECLPYRSDEHDAILALLSSLGSLVSVCDHGVIVDRLCRISTLDNVMARKLAERLLIHLNDCSFDYRGVDALRTVAWLPTLNGLRRANECRDDSEAHASALFDHVLAVLEVPSAPPISPRLREGLGWHQHLPLDVLTKQLQVEVSDSPCASRLELLIRELGRRVGEMGAGELAALREITQNVPWIPISLNTLSGSSQAILDQNFSLNGFYIVPAKFAFNEDIRRFLQSMGCSDRPSNASLCVLLQGLCGRLLDDDEQTFAVDLINSLDLRNLNGHEANIRALDRTGRMRPVVELFYNDLGPRSNMMRSTLNKFHVDRRIGEQLASSLGIVALSSLNLSGFDDDCDDEDMQEKLSTRIGNVLRQYSIAQAFNEFLANAADAGANRYSLLIDDHSAPSDSLLAPSLAQFQTGSSLIVYNDAVFKDPEDFQGIRSVGMGGKQDRVDSIGKFGLGALSMFHFSEIAMVVSGLHVLFLDPSGQYLPPRSTGRPRTALKVPLSSIHEMYGDHMKAITGIFDFLEDMNYYKGTIFWLPLRDSKQASKSHLTQEPIDLSTLRNLIRNYHEAAKESLLFIPVQSISAFERGRRDIITQTWQVEMETTAVEIIGDITLQTIAITHRAASARAIQQRWYIVRHRDDLSELSPEFQSLIKLHRMRETSVAVAALLDVKAGQRSSCRLYSKLPLPTLTALPLHLDASWILADDRRTIRFDESGQTNLESRYNTWLLSDKMVKVYAALLETWPETQNVPMWPGNLRITVDDKLRAVKTLGLT
ncbi:hypothetical protein K474DRAFT_1712121 [Panus rudis PR-1116 ss-1]|nr:hypothetical protein K474DRAFT_1712121 [Panus rudis PR-1116 ss-1]